MENITFKEIVMTARYGGSVARWQEELWSSQTLMKRTYINGDTYLNCWCPNCGEGLNEDRRAVFRITNQSGEEELHHASPYLNVLDQRCFLHMDGEELTDLSCPHCSEPLMAPDEVCEANKCKMAAIHVSVKDSIKLSLNFSVSGTSQSYIMSDEDNERLILRESQEW
jgi:predicted RNA-binding Zn-ribbon protein involved in translation (DUF1610 family)